MGWQLLSRPHHVLTEDVVVPQLEGSASLLRGYDAGTVVDGTWPTGERVSLIVEPVTFTITAVVTDPFGVSTWWRCFTP